jgi:hypothetical protein
MDLRLARGQGVGALANASLQAHSVAWSAPPCLLVAGLGGVDKGVRTMREKIDKGEDVVWITDV